MPTTPTTPPTSPTTTAQHRPLKAPFPYFGGKSRVARIIWAALGDDVRHYIEPFAGSAATLLACPDELRVQLRSVVLNDIDCHVANAWRAMRDHADQLADLCDEPLIEAELEARHKHLCSPSWRSRFERRVRDEAAFCDPVAAAYWITGMSCWIGGGFAAGDWHGHADPRTRGTGLAAPKLPHMTSGNGTQRLALRAPRAMHAYFRALQQQLRGTRVLSGDWRRAVGRYTTHLRGPVGVLLDPPYAASAERCESIYRHDDLHVSHHVRDWAIKAGRDRTRRIVLCGYDGEHPPEVFDRRGWTTIAWSAQGGYANQRRNPSPTSPARPAPAPPGCNARNAGNPSNGQLNRHRERLWLSPGCTTGPALEAALRAASATIIAHTRTKRSPR